MKEQLARLTKLVEDHVKTTAIHSQCPSPFPVQPIPHLFPHPLYPSPRPFIPATSNTLSRTYYPNPQPPMPIPTTMPAFVIAPRSVNQPSNSRGRPNGQKISKDKTQWDPIRITYTELLPKLIKGGLVVPIHLLPLKPPFPKQYDARAHCDYHSRISGHSMENCIAFKNEGKGWLGSKSLDLRT